MAGRFQVPSYLTDASPEELRGLLDIPQKPIPPSTSALQGRQSHAFKSTRNQAEVDVALLLVQSQAKSVRDLEKQLAEARERLDSLVQGAIAAGATTTEVGNAGRISRVTISKIMRNRPKDPSPRRLGRPKSAR